MRCFFLTLFLALFSVETYAKDVEVEAVGVGKDYDWAVMNALDNAVKQTNDVVINRTAPMSKMEVNTNEKLGVSIEEQAHYNDGSLVGGDKSASYSGKGNVQYSADASVELKEINAKYEGKITSYNVISSEKKDDGLYYVKIKAIVKKTDDYESPDLIRKAKYTLSIVPFKADKQISCVGQKVSSAPLIEKISSVLSENLFKSKKFNIVDRDNLDAYADELSLVANGLTKEDKGRLKNIASADYILVGKIENFNTNKTTQNVPMTGESYSNSSASIQISYKLLETATMEVIFASSVDEGLKKGGSFSSCNNVEKELAKKAGNKIANDILRDLFPDYQPKIEAPKEKIVKKIVAPAKQSKPQTIKLPFD